jgi:hypothetical protein
MRWRKVLGGPGAPGSAANVTLAPLLAKAAHILATFTVLASGPGIAMLWI